MGRANPAHFSHTYPRRKQGKAREVVRAMTYYDWKGRLFMGEFNEALYPPLVVILGLRIRCICYTRGGRSFSQSSCLGL